MKYKNAAVLALSAAGMLFAAGANAIATSTANMNVYLTVVAACNMTVDDMDFGTHASNEGLLRARSNARITCTKGAPYKLTADSSHTYKMVSKTTTDQVSYTLYSDSAGQVPLAMDLPTDTSEPTGTGSGAVQVVPVYGRVTAADLAAANVGSYSDIVTLQLTY